MTSPVRLVLAATWVAMMALAFAGSCSVNHRSDNFQTCERQTDCPEGQMCISNLCQGNAPDDAGIDGPGRPDALQCPSQCTSCKLYTMECKVDCAISMATCNAAIKCPPGWNCNIFCSTPGACRNGIDCQEGESCSVQCSGGNSCRNIDCGDGPCRVQCTGEGSCRDVACNDSCRCDVECNNVGALCDAVSCGSQTCDTGRGCSSLLPGCNTCQ